MCQVSKVVGGGILEINSGTVRLRTTRIPLTGEREGALVHSYKHGDFGAAHEGLRETTERRPSGRFSWTETGLLLVELRQEYTHSHAKFRLGFHLFFS